MKKFMRTKRGIRARALANASGRAAGFTLIEMLVAVGAVAFVAVGIASIFASVGDTVSRGRSVSAITQYAAVLERQMREDFALMTRDGYLIIRHEQADEGGRIPLYPDQPSGQWRERRIDELMFFINAPSESAREPLAPGFVPQGPSARVYYGIGQQRRPDGVGSLYALPSVQDDNLTGFLPGRNVPGNPNRFARDWTLLRHKTVLAPVGGSQSDNPGITGPVADNRVQIALQPAAESIFRSVNRLNTASCSVLFPAAPALWESFDARTSGDVSPLFASGLVDVATTSLEEIRGIVQSSAGLLVTPPASGAPAMYQYLSPDALTNCADYFGPSYVVGPVGVQQAWMIDGLPAPSHSRVLEFSLSSMVPPGVEPGYRYRDVPIEQRARMRYEPAPPDMHSQLAEAVTNPTRSAVRLADQYALSSSAFIPRVSEFIVEWSFGKLDEDGQMIWHGAERGVDYDGDGTDDLTIYPYPEYYDDVRGTPADLAGSFFVPYRLQQPAPSGVAGVGDEARTFTNYPLLGQPPANFLNGDFADVGDTHASYPVLPEVIHGVRASGLGTGGSTAPTVSYFGYTLPFFDPEDPDGDGNAADAAAQETLEWPWPELVRVTVTLTDPGDETIERTFQYVFPTPGNTAR